MESDERRAIGLARGIARHFEAAGLSSLAEFTVKNGRRADVIALDQKGRFTIVEIKTSLADFRSDTKWQDYLEFCDFFYFAVDTEFPRDRIPEDCGLIIADAYEATIIRPAEEFPMNGNRRRTQTLRFARTGAQRLSGRRDPSV